MTTDVGLRDNLVVINYTMRYTGRDRHPMMTQEVPAVFTVRNLSVLAFYDGTEPFKGKPVRWVGGWRGVPHVVALTLLVLCPTCSSSSSSSSSCRHIGSW
jgi:hypothetical protein